MTGMAGNGAAVWRAAKPATTVFYYWWPGLVVCSTAWMSASLPALALPRGDFTA